GSASARSPSVSCQAGCVSPAGAPKNWVTFLRATSADSSRRSYDDTRPYGPTARSSEHVSAPDPTPASTTWAPGKMSASATIWAASLGYTTAAPRGIETTNSESKGRNTRYSPPAEDVT